MKAPDKIYLTTSAENEKHGNNWGCWTDKECPGETYIRKDALLEWLKEMKRICRGAEPIEKAYQTILDKLNSM